MNEETKKILNSVQTQVTDLETQFADLKLELKSGLQTAVKLSEGGNLPPHQHKIDRVNTKDLVGGLSNTYNQTNLCRRRR